MAMIKLSLAAEDHGLVLRADDSTHAWEVSIDASINSREIARAFGEAVTCHESAMMRGAVVMALTQLVSLARPFLLEIGQ
jgi:hypothetical protein